MPQQLGAAAARVKSERRRQERCQRARRRMSPGPLLSPPQPLPGPFPAPPSRLMPPAPHVHAVPSLAALWPVPGPGPVPGLASSLPEARHHKPVSSATATRGPPHALPGPSNTCALCAVPTSCKVPSCTTKAPSGACVLRLQPPQHSKHHASLLRTPCSTSVLQEKHTHTHTRTHKRAAKSGACERRSNQAAAAAMATHRCRLSLFLGRPFESP